MSFFSPIYWINGIVICYLWSVTHP